jgi:branched-subunit amino acid ABC-type transport system permease component
VDILGPAVGFGLVTSAIIALGAVALSLQFGVTNIPNFAHGELLTFGAYGALLGQLFTTNPLVDTLIAMIVSGLTALGMNRFVLQSFQRIGARRIQLLVVTAGLSLVLQNVLAFFVGEQSRQLVLPASGNNDVRVGPFLWTQIDVVVMVVAVVVITALYALLRFTKFGKAQRAVAESPELALVSGINVPRIVNLTWLIAGVITGLAGVEIASTGGTIVPTMGNEFLLVIFAAAVVGGLGKPFGALIGALIIGVSMEVSAAFTNPAYKTSIAVGILIVALLFRPSGLFSNAQAVT